MEKVKKIRAGIIGGAGYTGGELIRLLINHPSVEMAFINSQSNAGNPVSKIHQDLIGETDLQFSNDLHNDIDVLFLCVGHGDARKFMEANTIDLRVKVIDLSQDFRLRKNAVFAERTFAYGLPELNRQEIQSANNIANPGCFATAIQLGLLPLAKAGLLQDVYTTGITGSTGAGQGLSSSSHFSWRANNVQAYKTLSHQHLHEIHQSLHQLQPGFPAGPGTGDNETGIHFVPWRGDFTRGIFISSTVNCSLPLDELADMYKSFYHGHPFTTVSDDAVFLKQVVNTNKTVLQLERAGRTKLVVHSVMDNLLKGASGQAVQNMNLAFGIDEAAGLHLKANYF